jgi:hypothetical protein
MQTKTLTAILTASLLAVGVSAQTSTATSPQVATPSPLPVTNPAPAPVQPNRIIYAPQLPSPAELTSAAAAQGVLIEKIDQSASQVAVTYKDASGQTSVVSYQLLSAAGTTAPAPAPAPVSVVASRPVVVYPSAPRVIYYDTYEPAYYPRYYAYPPVSLHLGFGYYHGFGGGYHRWR